MGQTQSTASFGYWVRRQRMALDLTQADLARTVGCATVTISKIERDERRPSRQMAELLAQHLAVPEGEQERFIAAALGARSSDRMPLIDQPLSMDEEAATPIDTRHNLPAQTTPFIGRRQELDKLVQFLADNDTRLITILAPGGMGKTRLGLAAAETQLASFPDGVFFVRLAPLTSPENIVTAVADTIGFSFFGNDPPQQQLFDYLRQREALLVMDNFEHLLDGAPFVARILDSAPRVKVLATSREKLNLSGETVLTLSGLEFLGWETLEEALENDAAKLFFQSARRIRPDFELQADDLDSLLRICHLTAGMPLGLVLAAGWLDVMSLERIAAEIQQGIDILETEQRDMPERQRSVRATFNYSWARLADFERDGFKKLSVFRGGFTAEAAQAVAGSDIRLLRRLMNKALIHLRADDRYDIHELLRQYGQEQLEQTHETERIQAAHRHYFAEFMRTRGEDIQGRRQLDGLNEIEADFDNVRIAWAHAIECADYEALDHMSECLLLFCEIRNRFQEAEDLCQRALWTLSDKAADNLHPAVNRMRVSWLRAWLLQARFPVPETIQEQTTHALRLARLQNDQHTVAWSLWIQGESGKTRVGDVAMTLDFGEQALTRFRELGDSHAVGYVLRSLSFNHLFLFAAGDDHQFEDYNQQHLEWTRDDGDRAGMAHALLYAAMFTERQGDIKRAFQHYQEAATIWLEVGDRKSLAFTIIPQAFNDLFRGRWSSARQMANQLMTIGAEANFKLLASLGQVMLRLMAVIEGDYKAGPPPAERTDFHTPMEYELTEYSRCLAAIGTGDYEEAQQRFKHAIQSPHLELSYVKPPQWLAAAVPILAHAGRHAQAAELLWFVRSQSQELVGWLKHWTLLTDLQHDLEANLGPESYSAAGGRGAKLNVETVVEEISAEFGWE